MSSTVKKWKAFTLIELLIAFSISTILLGSIYFFYISFVKTGSKTREMAFLNMDANNELEKLGRELKYAVEITALYPDRIQFKRQKLPPGELSVLDLETSKLETIEYKIVFKEGRAHIMKQVGLSAPKSILRVNNCNKDVFKGYVLSSAEGDNFKGKDLPFPSFTPYDSRTQNSNELNRIPIVKLTFELENRNDKVCFIGKVFMPVIYSRLVEPDWNEQ